MGYGANCGVGSADLLGTILVIAEHAGNATLISKGNAGIQNIMTVIFTMTGPLPL